MGVLGKSKKLIRRIIRKFLEFYPLGPLSLSLPSFSPTGLPSDAVLRELQLLGNFTYLPNGGNMGDTIIATAEYLFFDKHGLKYNMFRDGACTENLVHAGGGAFVPYYDIAYDRLSRILPNNSHLKRIILLPASFYDRPDFLELVDERFTIFCREEKSRDYLLSSGVKGNVILAHDMALLLTEDFQKLIPVFRYGFKKVWREIMASIPKLTQQGGYTVAYFIRADDESNTDWSKIGIQPTLDLSACAFSWCEDRRDVAFLCKLFFAGIDMADIVVTDRLHVGIGSMLMGKEVFLLDNSYGKVAGVYKHSMKQCPRVHYVDDVQDLPSILAQTIAEGKIHRTASLENMKKIGKALP